MKCVTFKKIGVNAAIIFFLLIVIPIGMGLAFGGIDRTGSIMICVFTFGVALTLGFLGLKNLILLIFGNLVLLVMLFVTSLCFAYRPNAYIQIIDMLLLFYWLILVIVNIIAAAKFSSDYFYLQFVPILISVLTIIGTVQANKLGHWQRIRVFHANLPQYNLFVKEIEKQLEKESSINLYRDDIPDKYKKLARLVFAYKENNGSITIEFAWGGGFPVKHAAYAYLSDGQVSNDFRKRWPYIEKLNDNWFRVGD